MKNITRKSLVIAFSAAALSLALVFTVWAYFAAQDDKNNVFTIGNIGTVTNASESRQISETFSSPEIQAENETVTKTVSVRNNSSNKCFARMYFDFSDSKIRDNAKIYVGETEYSWSDFISTAKGAGINGWKYIDPSENNTALAGYFYYMTALDAKSGNSIPTTQPLFTSVKTDFRKDTVPDGLPQEDFIKNYNIIVYSETVQTVETSTGLDYSSTNNWKEAWQSFLKVT